MENKFKLTKEYILSRLIQHTNLITIIRPGSCWFINTYIPEETTRSPLFYINNLKNGRTARLETIKSNPNNENFEKIWKVTGKNFNLDLIPEYPIPLDMKFWKETYMGKDRKHNTTTYISLDYFIPELNVAIELDSNFHNYTEDQHRDLYLKLKHNIHVIRLRTGFLQNKQAFSLITKDLSRRLAGLIHKRINPTRIDQSDFLYRTILILNGPILNLIQNSIQVSEEELLLNKKEFVGVNREKEIIHKINLTVKNQDILTEEYYNPFLNRKTTGEILLKSYCKILFDPKIEIQLI